jgi:hypothetical protein
MELASQDLIAQLLHDAAQIGVARARRGDRMVMPLPERRTTSPRRPRCHCGECRQCQDDARWDRIFREKFADPEYYTRCQVRCGSPLESL